MIVAHLDLDAFFAAVEELESPELAAQPLVVGGDPRGRGVVATANYVARAYGIRSAMSCAEALRRCPHAVFVPPRHRTYAEYSRTVWAAIREVVPRVERTGLDEGYLDIGEVAPDYRRARVVAEAVQAAVRGATSLSCSLGVASCKVVAKVASDRKKPGGITVVPAGREAAFLAPFPVRLLPGVGPKAEERLAAGGRRAASGSSQRSPTASSRGCSRGRAGACSATARRASTRGRSRSPSPTSRSATRRRSRATSPTASSSTTSCAAWPSASPPTWRSPARSRGR